MNLEFEVFGTVNDLLTYLSAAAPPMKNVLPIHSYRGYVSSFVPLGTTGDAFLVILAKGELEKGIYEFDLNTAGYKKVDNIDRADKFYYVTVMPEKNTLADAALDSISS